MKVTLRKAAKLLTKIEQKIGDLDRETQGKLTKQFSAYDINVIETLNIAQEEVKANVGNVLLLYSVRETLRASVGEANAALGVGNKLAHANMLENSQRVLRHVLRYTKHDPRPADDIITARLEGVKARASSVAAQVRDSESFSTISTDLINQFEASMRQIELDLDKTLDELENLNATNSIEISDTNWAALTAAGIVQ